MMTALTVLAPEVGTVAPEPEEMTQTHLVHLYSPQALQGTLTVFSLESWLQDGSHGPTM